jgi:hypothetical protein
MCDLMIIVRLMESYNFMGQLESCMREENKIESEQLPRHIEPQHFAVGVDPLLFKTESIESHQQTPSQYSSVVQKLKNYDKKELAKMLTRPPPSCV